MVNIDKNSKKAKKINNQKTLFKYGLNKEVFCTWFLYKNFSKYKLKIKRI
jgi:hypothetical protein